MSAKIQKKYSVNAAGQLNVFEDGRIGITNSDTGETFELSDLLSEFNSREVKITCNYAEDIV
jgi:hypothetical protein